MADKTPAPAGTNSILVKLRPTGGLRAAESRANLRPLYDEEPRAAASGFGLDSAPRWFLAELPDGAATHWDLAHARVAAQLGVDASDVIFAEPDLVHNVYRVAFVEASRRRDIYPLNLDDAASDTPRALFFAPDRHGEPFAALHALADDGL